jgi:hypothetical protein
MQSEKLINDGQMKIGMTESDMQESGDQTSQPLDSEKQLVKQQGQETSQSLPQSVSVQLVALMRQVTEKEVTPTTVRAACECARVVNELLKTNLEMIRRGL